jgi:hypothetical protein
MVPYETLPFTETNGINNPVEDYIAGNSLRRRRCVCFLAALFTGILWFSIFFQEEVSEETSLPLVDIIEKTFPSKDDIQNQSNWNPSSTNHLSTSQNQSNSTEIHPNIPKSIGNQSTSNNEEIIASKLPNPVPFFDDPDRMCLELLTRANGTEEGHEPWRATGGLLWTCYPCEEQGISVLGNHLSRWYMARAVAAGAGVSIQIDCKSPATDLIRQYWEPSDTVFVDGGSFSWKATCQYGLKYPHGDFRDGGGLDQMVDAIRLDLRNMTEYLVTEYPWFSQDLDEATIHLRIGDIGRQEHGLYGLIPFHVYKKLIPKGVKSIGIITAPFKQNRPAWGYGDADLNERVSLAVQDYLQQTFPEARVSIRNDDVNETMAMTYARMISANWSFCGSSTFCLYPALATRGESYILQSPLFGGSPTWITKVEAPFSNIHYVQEELVLSSETWNWNVSDIVKRIQRDTSE